MSDSPLKRSFLSTPIGVLEIESTPRGISAAMFVASEGRSDHTGILDRCVREFAEYFSGKRREFTVPLDPRGTEFQRKVWERLIRIPYGQTTTYGTIAAEFGLHNGARAVGSANGSNPISIIVPCHRVVASDGALTGYAGGLERKAWLLEHEGSRTRQTTLMGH